VDERDETTPSQKPLPPSASRGDRAMQSRIAERLFGDPPEPQLIARYEIIGRLGAGGMGIVHAAHDPQLDRKVAIKQLRRATLAEPERTRLVAEARALARLSHANVVHVYEVGEYEGDVYVVMEFVDGTTLAQWQREKRSLAAILRVYASAGAGLHAAHEAGLVHRDFKPANVLVGRTPDVIKVADFGLAMPAHAVTQTSLPPTDGSQTQTSHRVAGTPGYIAPEVLAGAAASRASDIYGFCVSLWEAVDGRRLFYDPPGALPPFAGPRWLKRLLARGLAADPTMRWPDIESLTNAIRRRFELGRAGWFTAGIAPFAIAGVAWLSTAEQVASCEFDPEVPANWTDESRERIRQNLADEDPAGLAVSAIDTAFENLGRRRADTRTRVCRAHHQDRTLSAAGLDRATACLDSSVRKADMIAEQLTAPSTDVYGQFDELLASLPRPDDCIDSIPTTSVSALRSPARLLLNDRLTRDGELALAAGQHQAALATAQDIAARAAELHDLALEAEALDLLGASHYEIGQPEQALAALQTAAQRAYSADAPALLVRVAIRRAEILSYDRDDPEAATEALTLVDPMLAQLGEAPELRADLLLVQGLIAEQSERPSEAQRLIEQAIDLHRASGAPEAKLDAATARLANAAYHANDGARALRLHEEVLRNQRARLGPDHPRVATTEFNLATVLNGVGHGLESLSLLEHVLAVRARRYGDDSIRLAPVQTLLADVYNGLGDHERAIVLAQRAWNIQRDRLPVGHVERGMALRPLGWAQLVMGEFEQSLATHEAILAETQPSAEDRAGVNQTIGWLLARLKRYGAASVYSGRALLTDNPIIRANAEIVLAEVAFRWQQPDELADRLTSIKQVIDQLATPDPALVAEWRWLDAISSGRARTLQASDRNYLTNDQLVELDALTPSPTQRNPSNAESP
jgi:serine/threonine protein kinase